MSVNSERFLVLTDQEQVAFAGEWYDSLTDIPANSLNQQQPIDVYYYGAQVTFHRLTFPKMKSDELASALVFALEENLSQSIESMHFTTLRKQSVKDLVVVDVAVVANEFLQSCEDKLKQANLTYHSLIPLAWLIPTIMMGSSVDKGVSPTPVIQEAEQLILWVDKDLIVVQRHGDAIVVVRRDNFLSLSSLLLVAGKEQTDVQRSWVIYGQLAEGEMTWLKKQSIQLDQKVAGFSIFAMLKMMKVEKRELREYNLLQGEFHVKTPRFQFNFSWQVLKKYAFPGLLLSLTILSVIGAMIGYHYQLREQSEQLEAQIRDYSEMLDLRYVSNSSKERVMVGLSHAQRLSHRNRALQILEKIAPLLSQAQKLKLQVLHMARNRLQLVFLADSMTTVQNLTQKIKERHFDAQLSVDKAGKKATYRVVIQ